MTIDQLRRRFAVAIKELRNIECSLLSGSERVQVEQLNNKLIELLHKIESSTEHSKKLTIVNYEAIK